MKAHCLPLAEVKVQVETLPNTKSGNNYIPSYASYGQCNVQCRTCCNWGSTIGPTLAQES